MRREPKTLKGFIGRFGEKKLIEILNMGFNSVWIKDKPKRKPHKPRKPKK